MIMKNKIVLFIVLFAVLLFGLLFYRKSAQNKYVATQMQQQAQLNQTQDTDQQLDADMQSDNADDLNDSSLSDQQLGL